MLSNAYFLAKFRFDTAENEPAKNLLNLLIVTINCCQFSGISPPRLWPYLGEPGCFQAAGSARGRLAPRGVRCAARGPGHEHADQPEVARPYVYSNSKLDRIFF